MKQRTAGRLAWIVWGFTVASLVGFLVWGTLAHVLDAGEYALIPVIVLGFATVGALIVSRRGGNTIGWVFSWFALAGSFGFFAGNYAIYGIETAPGSVPAATLAGWIGRSAFAATLLPIPLMFLLFPDGRVPTRRWRPVLWVILAAAAVTWVGFSFGPGPLNAGFTELHRSSVENPLAFPVGWKAAVETVSTVAGFVVFAGGLASVLALVLRFRRSRGEERQQIRWLVYVGATAVGVLLLELAVEAARPLLGIEVSENDLFSNISFIVFTTLLLVGIPAAAAIAILKYRLYELDVVIKKTVVFAILVVLITAMALLVILAVGGLVVGPISDSPAALIAAGTAIGLLVWPLRRVSRRIADRVVFGGRSTPYEVLSEFSGRVAGAYATEDVLPRMAHILGSGTGASEARVWLRVGGELRPASVWPGEADEPIGSIRIVGDVLPDLPAGLQAVEVRHQGELLGALTVEMPANDPMNPTKEKLVRDLASQAGLVLRNVRLIEELRASRHRLVAAQDEERRKIERNLHDGAQQQLVALSVKLRLARSLWVKDPAKADGMMAELETETGDALENLRDLARGIYPPLLADQGLAAALEAQARKSPIPVEVVSNGVGRFGPEVEATVYFCALEAMQNMAKYADASRATITLGRRDEELVFQVCDDGRGFDPGLTRYGTGLQGMADRLDAIGGALRLRSTPGHGTTVEGRIPLVVGTEHPT